MRAAAGQVGSCHLIAHAIAVVMAEGIAIAEPSSAPQPAKRIRSGGTVLTMDDKAMHGIAVAARSRKIVAVGSMAVVLNLKHPNTELIDLKAPRCCPG